MYIKMLGAALLLIGLALGVIVVAKVQTYYTVETFAKAEQEDDSHNVILTDLKDQIINVPPNNSSEGWVGFNITLPNQEKPNYEAYGVILPADKDPDPLVMMFAVNETGADLLAFDGFATETWNVTKVYAKIMLDSNYRSDLARTVFGFSGLENCPRYVVLFRGYKEEDKSRPFLISVKESWLENKNMLELNAVTIALITITATAGAVLLIYDLVSGRQKRIRREQRATKKKTSQRETRPTIRYLPPK